MLWRSFTVGKHLHLLDSWILLRVGRDHELGLRKQDLVQLVHHNVIGIHIDLILKPERTDPEAGLLGLVEEQLHRSVQRLDHQS